jgi:Outer membrane protein beta-barrel domain
MKKLLFLFVFFTTVQVATTNAQSFKYGIRGGISTPDIKPSDVDSLRILRGTEALKLKVSDANYGFHFGIWARLKLANFYLQPEVVFNSSKVQYKFGKFGSAIDSIRSQTFQKLDIPVMLGTKVGSFRLNAGPVAHINIGGSSDLIKTSGFTETVKTATWGYQAGIGFDAGKVGIDIRYEGNFDNFGNQLMIGGKSYEFSKAPTRFIASASIAF